MLDRIHRIEAKLLVLLHILVIRKRDALHRGEKTHERPIDAAAFPADELCDIRIFLLRHDTRAGRIGI